MEYNNTPQKTNERDLPIVPPSTFIITPVHQDPARLAKYIEAPIISFSLPNRPNGILFPIESTDDVQLFNPSLIFVFTNPGAIQLTF